ncbi:MAG: thiolase family protein [Clostridiales bacterium]|nr:thiolase family protein [Clostridiales bacterium]
MRDVVITEACRTAVGKFGGTLKPLNAADLATAVLKGVLDRSQIDPEMIDEVIMGHCRQCEDYSNTARVAALRAGIPEKAPASTVMYACASGMLATGNAFNSIATGQNDIVIAGGTESMSNAPFYLSNARWGVGTGTTELKDSLTEGQFNSQPQDIYGRFNMGMTAENVAAKMNISREDQDAFALESQQKARAAIDAGRFADEIIPLTVPQGRKKPPVTFDTDEFPRETSMEKLAKLNPAFQPEGGTVTAGNASGRNDGASALLLMGADKAQELGQKPLARILGVASAGVDPRYMGLGPVPATRKVLKMTGLTLDDIQLIELNEAFAAQSLGCIRELGLEDRRDIINVNGGAIALGHPIGSSGSRIIVTLIHEMRKRNLRYGLATLCIAGGMGMATVVEVL